jgi:hypothetical protein
MSAVTSSSIWMTGGGAGIDAPFDVGELGRSDNSTGGGVTLEARAGDETDGFVASGAFGAAAAVLGCATASGIFGCAGGDTDGFFGDGNVGKAGGLGATGRTEPDVEGAAAAGGGVAPGFGPVGWGKLPAATLGTAGGFGRAGGSLSGGDMNGIWSEIWKR